MHCGRRRVVANAAGIERIDTRSWNIVQNFLRTWISSPVGIRKKNPESLRDLANALMMGGFAMQALKSSRPAPGAEHQFSHLWEMQNHIHDGKAPSHGFKAGNGKRVSLVFYEGLPGMDRDFFVMESALDRWPSVEDLDDRTAKLLGPGELGDTGRREICAKYMHREEPGRELIDFRENRPVLKDRLRAHLLSFADARLKRDHLRRSYGQAYFIRRSFAVLDFAALWGLTDSLLDGLSAPGGSMHR
jgi:glycerol-1-phosphate dehydrogenase [NAD(P)+]